jgi:hypothetical protein
MNKKAILTCGYFSLNNANKELHKRGYDIIKIREMNNPKLDSFCIDDSERLAECLEKESIKYLYENREEPLKEGKVSLLAGERQAVSFFGAGGKNYFSDEILSCVISSKFMGSIININGTYDYFMEVSKRYNIKAVLVHTAEGASWGTVVRAAKELGIPTFCCYNGTIAKYITDFTAHNFFGNADYFYLHGQYDVDWLERRVNAHYNPSTMPLVGQPTFDTYYDRKGKIKKPGKKPHNVFLYNSAVVYSSFDVPRLNLRVTLDMIDYALYRDYMPSNLDDVFIKAFGVYQKKVNPSAELIIPLRPYYTAPSEGFLKYVLDSGVKNVKVFDHMDRPFRSLVKNARYVISGASTVLVESLLNRKALLCLTGNSDRVPFDYIKDWAAVARTDNSDTIIEGLIDMTKNENELIHNCEKYATHFNYGDDGKAGERLAEDLVGKIE